MARPKVRIVYILVPSTSRTGPFLADTNGSITPGYFVVYEKALNVERFWTHKRSRRAARKGVEILRQATGLVGYVTWWDPTSSAWYYEQPVGPGTFPIP